MKEEESVIILHTHPVRDVSLLRWVEEAAVKGLRIHHTCVVVCVCV